MSTILTALKRNLNIYNRNIYYIFSSYFDSSFYFACQRSLSYQRYNIIDQLNHISPLVKFLRSLSILIIVLLTIGSCTDDDTNLAPLVEDSTVIIEENSPAGTIVTSLFASDPEEVPLIFDITDGNLDDAFDVSQDGVVVIANAEVIDFETYPVFNLTIQVSDGIDESQLKLRVIIRDDEEEDLRPLTVEELEIMDYFTEISLGFEFGSASKVTRKWIDTMKVYVDGDTSAMLLEELTLIISEINELVTDGFYIERVSTKRASNMHVFLGSGADYSSLYPSAANFVGSNWGLFFVFYNGASDLFSAHMYVDTERANDMAQRHLLREEFTQSLGLARDANTHPGSIFTQQWTTTTGYIDIDKAIISMLYHPRMSSGLNEQETRQLIASIFREG